MNQSTAFLMTIALEAPIVWFAFYRSKLPSLRIIGLGIIPTLLTHPILWWVLVNLPMAINYHLGVHIGEIMVMVVEAIVLRILSRASWRLSLAVSIFANASSWMLGSQVFSWIRS